MASSAAAEENLTKKREKDEQINALMEKVERQRREAEERAHEDEERALR